jgi:hypothetical protein
MGQWGCFGPVVRAGVCHVPRMVRVLVVRASTPGAGAYPGTAIPGGGRDFAGIGGPLRLALRESCSVAAAACGGSGRGGHVVITGSKGQYPQGQPSASPELQLEPVRAIRVFTLRLLDTAGDVGREALQAFLASGYSRQNALEVVLGIGAYTMSTIANRLRRTR